MAQISSVNFCRLLRTKFSYFRAPGGDRLIDPDSTTACYTCLLTQRPAGPDGMPADVDTCGADRSCFSRDS